MQPSGREAISEENVFNSAHQYIVDSIHEFKQLIILPPVNSPWVLDLKDRRVKLVQEPNGLVLCSTIVEKVSFLTNLHRVKIVA